MAAGVAGAAVFVVDTTGEEVGVGTKGGEAIAEGATGTGVDALTTATLIGDWVAVTTGI